MDVKDLPTFVEMAEEEEDLPGLSEAEVSTETIDLGNLFGPEPSLSTSFDLQWINQASFGRLLQAIPIPTLFVDKSGKIVFCNRSTEKITPDYHQLKESHFSSLFLDGREMKAAELLLEQLFLDRKPKMVDGLFRFCKARIWGRMHLRSISVTEQRLVIALVENLTAEKKRLIENEKYKKLISLVPMGVAEFSLTQTVSADHEAAQIIEAVQRAILVGGNDQFAKIQGFDSISKLLHQRFDQLTPFDDQHRGLFTSWIRSGFHISSAEARQYLPSGSLGYVETTLIGMIRQQRLHAIWMLKRDITEQQRMREDAIRVQKLESLGLLAGGIAHDFNNILMAVLGNINLAKMYSTPGDKIYERLLEAERGTRRAESLTQQLLTFSKGGAPVKKVGPIVSLLKECAGFSLPGSNVRLEFAVPEDLWPVEVDEGQIAQVMNNLVINADQAMPDGGLVRISAENIVVGPQHGLALSDGKHVKISIADIGMGIPPEHIHRIFDPYFTTKQKGSGLGLAVSYSIVQAHGGLITVESKLSAGTTFHVFLPAKEQKTAEQQRVEPIKFEARGRVLIVDDEDMVRTVAQEMLQHIGYEVEGARDGREAIILYRKSIEDSKPFSAVVMDLTIPGGMGGKETIKELIKIDPAVKAIVSSGYANDPIMGQFQSYGFQGVVCKPYDVDDLAAVLGRVINLGA
ncbi:MAG: response regulator [Desulfomonile tiedjei]|nr:response regulator [Desulfomonile tiedjei]